MLFARPCHFSPTAFWISFRNLNYIVNDNWLPITHDITICLHSELLCSIIFIYLKYKLNFDFGCSYNFDFRIIYSFCSFLLCILSINNWVEINSFWDTKRLSVLIGGRSRSARKKPPIFDKKTDNPSELRLDSSAARERGSNSQPQCWMASNNNSRTT